MNFKSILYPFSLLYRQITHWRNQLFDRGFYKSIEFDLPVIAVGNLRVGGTGKTPHVEYILRLLSDKYTFATLSRGYKRHSKGFLLAEKDTTALDVGDEAQQIKTKFPNVVVAVNENRVAGIPFIIGEEPDIQVVILDDAFQHRQVRPGMNILLTTFDDPFTRDYVLPYGRLREGRSGYQRADVIVVTKCPISLSKEDKEAMTDEIQLLPHQRLFFSHLNYKDPYAINNFEERLSLEADHQVLLVCGIAQTKQLTAYLSEKVGQLEEIHFGDHHLFFERDLERIKKQFDEMEGERKLLLTTEKDAMRLHLHRDWLAQNDLKFYCLPVEVEMGEEDAQGFKTCLERYIK